MDITIHQLLQIMPTISGKKAHAYLPFLQLAMDEFEINTPLRQAAFLAQLAHESACLLYMEEIASGQAYEGRRDLGNTEKGDGKRFKGRGPIQLTGRYSYDKYGQKLGVDLVNHPEKAANPDIGFRIAGLFWADHGLNELADKEDFRAITRRINGGYNGYSDRLQKYELAKSVLCK